MTSSTRRSSWDDEEPDPLERVATQSQQHQVPRVSATRQRSSQAETGHGRERDDSQRHGEGRRSYTVTLPADLPDRMRDAVFAFRDRQGGHETMAALAAHALENELQRLYDEYNNGQPPPRTERSFGPGRNRTRGRRESGTDGT